MHNAIPLTLAALIAVAVIVIGCFTLDIYAKAITSAKLEAQGWGGGKLAEQV